MDVFRLSVLAFLFYAQVHIVGSSPSKDRDTWTVENLQQGKPQVTDLLVRIADLMKRSKSQQFHGLMGRSSGIPQPLRLGRKRNKGEIFVGLMGRRSSGDFQEEWERPRLY